MIGGLPPPPAIGEALRALEAALREAHGEAEQQRALEAQPSPASGIRAYENGIAVASLLDSVQAELLVEKLGIGSADNWKVSTLPHPAPLASFPVAAVRLPRTAQAPAHAPPLERYSARDLLALHDEAFVTNSYRAILRREPDAEGSAFFLEELNEGRITRLDLLGVLRASTEGRATAAAVPGLDSMLLRERLGRLPVMGYLFRALQALLRLPYLFRRLDAMEHHGNRVARSLNQITGLTETVLSEMRQRDAHLLDLSHHLVGRVNALQAADAARRANVRGLAGHVARLDASIAAARTVADACATRSDLHAVGEAARAALAALGQAVDAAQSALAENREHLSRTEGSIETLHSEARAFEEEARDFEVEARTHMRDAVASLGNAGTQISDVTAGLHGFAAETRGQLAKLAGDFGGLGKQLADVTSGLHGFATEARAQLQKVEAGLTGVGAQAADATSGLHGFAAETRGHFEKLEADLAGAKAPHPAIERLQDVVAETGPRIHELSQGLGNAGTQIADVTSGLHGFAAETRGQLRTLSDAINDHQRRVARLVDELGSAAGSGAAPADRAILDQHKARLLDAFYVEFERRFRGERVEIKRRLAVYVPAIKDSAAVTKRTPLLDVGCGRGELLEILKESAIPASGLDLNAIQVEECRRLGLVAVEAEALQHLRGMKNGALGAVTGMHIVEHFAFADLVALLDESFRVLKRGGLAIFETPNPENLIVGACTFWLDPTHVKPLPPEALRFLAQARGFAPVEVLRLNPFPDSERIKGGAAQLNKLLYGARDYAIVARKP